MLRASGARPSDPSCVRGEKPQHTTGGLPKAKHGMARAHGEANAPNYTTALAQEAGRCLDGHGDCMWRGASGPELEHAIADGRDMSHEAFFVAAGHDEQGRYMLLTQSGSRQHEKLDYALEARPVQH